jgi:hypothetical protein
MDYLEKMRYYETTAVDGEQEAFVKVVKTFGMGEEGSELTMFPLMLSKMAYNAVGVYFDQGRSDKVCSTCICLKYVR